MTFENLCDLEDVAGPGICMPVPRRLIGTAWQHVVEDDDTRGQRKLLDALEVEEGILEEM